MKADVVKRNSGPVPRYTSYPTAPQFSPLIGPAEYAAWLQKLAPETRLSLYLHVPFCRELCWYCACNTRAVRRYAPVASYLESLIHEMGIVSRALTGRPSVGHIHWGGGSPSMLSPFDVRRVARALVDNFDIRPDAEQAVEVDPRELSDGTIEALVASGVTRVSVGVQDFEEAVQAAINRHQSFEDTKRTIEAFRSRGVNSVNIDLVYGLPHQTVESADRTIASVLTLRPDRLAVFGYAHVPAKAKHQRLIDGPSLPGPEERIRQLGRITERVVAAGYKAIGIDHFALPADKLATSRLRRNFQGYTTDDSDALIGMGASSIGQLPQGYVQNATAVGEYSRRIEQGKLATARGYHMTDDDRLRGYVIERLMCDFAFSRAEVIERFGAAAAPVIEEAAALVANDQDGFVEATPDGFRCTPDGRTFVRTIAAKFDAYWGQGSATHALAV